MIPRVKTWQIKFYKAHSRPYAIIRVDAPTKLLAKLNARFDGRTAGQYINAWLQGPDRVTYGIVRGSNVNS